jgi:membrane associated rhomboid family serine protease
MDEPEATRHDGEAREAREPLFNLPGVVVFLIALCTGIHFARVVLFSPDLDFDLFVRTAFVPARYSGAYALDAYAFTTPLTYSLLHGSWLHLAVNMIWLAAFGSPLANRIGAARFLLFWVFTAVAAAALHFVLHSADLTPLVGASGAISGMMGAAARFGFQVDRRAARPIFRGPVLPVGVVFRSRAVMTFLAVWMVVNLVTGVVGFVPGVDDAIAWEAHVGGFLAGFFGVGLFDRGEGVTQGPRRATLRGGSGPFQA